MVCKLGDGRFLIHDFKSDGICKLFAYDKFFNDLYTIEIEGTNYFPVFKIINGKVNVLYTLELDKKEFIYKSKVCIAKNGKVEKITELFRSEKFYRGEISPKSRAFLFYSTVTKGKFKTLFIKVFDANFSPIGDYSISIGSDQTPYPRIMDDGSVIVQYIYEKKKFLKMVGYNLKGEEIFGIKKGDVYKGNEKLVVNPPEWAEGELFFTYYVSSKKNGIDKINVLKYVVEDKETFNMESKSFTEEYLSKIYRSSPDLRKKYLHAPEKINDFKTVQVLKDNEDNLYLIMQNQYKNYIHLRDNITVGEYTSEDILIMKFNQKGENTWSVLIPTISRSRENTHTDYYAAEYYGIGSVSDLGPDFLQVLSFQSFDYGNNPVIWRIDKETGQTFEPKCILKRGSCF